MDTKKVLLVKYGEIALRKGNRALYERQLMTALRNNLREYGGAIHVIREQGRFLIEDVRGDINAQAVLPKIQYIFGIAAICLCVKTDANSLPDLQRTGLAVIRETRPVQACSFKVETKRGDKRYPLPSREVSSEVGGYILENEPGITVDVHNPTMVLWIEIRTHTYLYTHSIAGEGGLPYGSSGKGLLLMSGGIDSPVAGYLMARRGVEIVPVYFHSPPYTSERVVDKVTDLTRQLARYTGGCRMYVVPFTETQMFLYAHVPPAKLTILLKRAMLHIASELAAAEKASCLITGDSVGQVASQTLQSLEAVNTAAQWPILRPLAGMDKQQIIDIALRLGTYDISIRPYEDCCTLFVAEHPECKPKASVIEGIESRLTELPALWSDAATRAVVYDIN